MINCDNRRHESIGKLARSTTALQQLPRSPSPANIVTTHRPVFENQAPEELPEAEPHLTVSEPSLYVVTFVHSILSCDDVNSIPGPHQWSATQHLTWRVYQNQNQTHSGIFDIRDRLVIQHHIPGMREHASQQYTRMRLVLSRKKN